ncbi:MAG: NADH-dependent [FeFe] hydrogenase, group A6 [Oscillospiraceae bacterium]
MEKLVNIKINDMELSVPSTMTILEAAKAANIEIPTLCYLKEINQIGACRICVVEVKGARSLVTACTYPVAEGMEVYTNTQKVHDSRRLTLELILSTHDRKCLSCVRSGNCELQRLCHLFGVDNEVAFEGENHEYQFDDSAVHMYRDNNKCILCRRCVAACTRLQTVGVIGANDRGFETHIGCAFDQTLDEVACVSCGQCIVVCPTGAIAEKDETQKVWDAINDPTKHVIVQTAPSIRATIGEGFDLPIGTDCTGKMAAALRRLGFDGVFDTDFAADMTIIEEATELLDRLQGNGPLPLFTSCSPGWIKFCEHYYPEFIPHLSSCKSPQQIFGAIAKTWYAKKNNLDPKDIFVVGVMPCTAKKFEVNREDENAADVPDCDVALTTREVVRMIKRAGIEFADLPDEDFDPAMGESTGAGVIFGATGGVMEAALRTAVSWVEGKDLTDKLDFEEVRGFSGIKEATYNVGGTEVKVAVASGLGNARRLLDAIKSGEKKYHFVEIMGCPGGCINGGGQPVQYAHVRNFVDLRSLRAQVLYNQDKGKAIRLSHKNPLCTKIYDDFLEKPGSHKAHEILHTSYKVRSDF